jgi:hypothetical protein
MCSFEKPKVPFKKILTRHIRSKVMTHKQSATDGPEQQIGDQIQKFSFNQLKVEFPTNLLSDHIKSTQQQPKNKANEPYPHMRELHRVQATEIENEVGTTVQQTLKAVFLSACVREVLPHCPLRFSVA